MATINTTGESTNRSDFTWPRPTERQRIFQRDQCEYKGRFSTDTGDFTRQPSTQLYHSIETLLTIPDHQNLPFDFNFRPKPILSHSPLGHYPTEVCD